MQKRLPYSCAIALWTLSSAFSWAEQGIDRQDEYPDFNHAAKIPADEWVQSIDVQEPAYRSDIQGDVRVKFVASGMKYARAFCWSAPTTEKPDAWGHDVDLTNGGIGLDEELSLIHI